MRTRLLAPPACAALLATAGLAFRLHAASLAEYDAAALAARPVESAARVHAVAARPEMLRFARVTATDERHGVPSFVWAVRQPHAAARLTTATRTPDRAAREQLSDIAPLWRLDRADIAGARLAQLHDTGRGAILIRYRQEIDGIQVFRDRMDVCLDRDLSLVSVSGQLPSRTAAPSGDAATFRLASERAVALSLRDFAGLPAEPAGLVSTGAREGGFESFAAPVTLRDRTDGLAVATDPRTRKVWFHAGDALEPAWYVEVMGETAAYAYAWSARDGRLLYRHSLMADAAFGYRVWANTGLANIPMDGPQGDAPSPHPTGVPDNFQPALTAPVLVSLQNGPISTSDPWLAPGATQTTGNNVDAYADITSPDGFNAGDVRATTTSPGVFDRTYDTNQVPGASTNQRMAAVTTLFYINNYLHDMFYDSGFDEASGNAQTDNYGRGGIAGDPVHAEGEDYGGTNNANMSTPSDGGSPRMQMYVFNNAGANLIVNAPGGIAGTYASGTAQFGPQNFTVTAQLVAGQDAIAPIDDACTAIVTSVIGKIALIDRGNCSFVVKVQSAQNAGAIGAIIVDNTGSTTPPGMGGTSGTITIPSMSVTGAVGAMLRANLGAGVNVTLNRPAQLQRDGTIDGHIVAHEWGHYISNRLIGDANGLTSQQGGGMGEGWGDFTSLLMTVRPGDNFAGCYATGGYALSGNLIAGNSYYFGVRRYPYSTDMTKNPLTFRHIQNGTALPAGPPLSGDATGANNSEVHNTGEVWCSMLWECYAALINDTGRLTFAQAHQHMKDILVGGYKLTPNAPTFTEARDAVLAAAMAYDPADFALMAQAFAKRGMGTGAVSPPRDDATNTGVVESYTLGGDVALASATLDDDLHNCDDDGYLDNGERASLRVTVANTGATSLTGTTVTVTSPNASVSFPSGNVLNVPTTAPFGSAFVVVSVDLTGASPQELVEFDVDVNDPGLLSAGPRSYSFRDWVNADEGFSTVDLFESHHLSWSMAGGAGSAGTNWAAVETAPGDHQLFVSDVGAPADLYAATPPLVVGNATPLVLNFVHHYSFEADATSQYDGGVIELSNNGGASWVDIGSSASPGYNGTLFSGSGNVLSGRSAWTAVSAGYPSPVGTSVNLGMAYAGQTVRIRFRMATDAAVGAPGWWIDNLAVSGITNTPFLGLVDELDSCTPLAVDGNAPRSVALAVAGDNPARGSARMRFALPAASRVQLTVHDLAGRRIATLADGEYSPGWHDAVFARGADGNAPGAGVYFARLLVNGKAYTQRIVMVR